MTLSWLENQLVTQRARARALWGALCLAGVLGACSHSHFDGAIFTKDDARYRVGTLGEGWRRVSVEDADLAFHRAGDGTISVNATCREYDDVPSVALLNHLLFGTTRRQFRVEEDLIVDGRAARHAIVDCELDGVPIRLEVVLVSRRGCVFDLTYVSDRRAAAHGEFIRFVSAFHIERAGR